MIKQLWFDEAGVILSAETVLVLTLAVLAMVVGLRAVSTKVSQELADLACAFGTLDQSFFVHGLEHPGHSSIQGSGFQDARDDCDCVVLVQTPADPLIQDGPPEGTPIAL